jgi:hypothetical protein
MGGGAHWGAGAAAGAPMPKPNEGLGGGVAAGDVTVCPQVGHGPLIPAMWDGTVSWVRQAPHSNWMTSDIYSPVRQLQLIWRMEFISTN